MRLCACWMLLRPHTPTAMCPAPPPVRLEILHGLWALGVGLRAIGKAVSS